MLRHKSKQLIVAFASFKLATFRLCNPAYKSCLNLASRLFRQSVERFEIKLRRCRLIRRSHVCDDELLFLVLPRHEPSECFWIKAVGDTGEFARRLIRIA